MGKLAVSMFLKLFIKTDHLEGYHDTYKESLKMHNEKQNKHNKLINYQLKQMAFRSTR